jgi:hypothetical protein
MKDGILESLARPGALRVTQNKFVPIKLFMAAL